MRMTNNQDDWMSLALKREAEIERLRRERDECERQYQEKVEEIGRLLDVIITMREALAGLVEAVTVEVNEKGGGGYILARLSDAREALRRGQELDNNGPVLVWSFSDARRRGRDCSLTARGIRRLYNHSHQNWITKAWSTMSPCKPMERRDRTMDNGSQTALSLMRLSHGGYLVADAYKPDHWVSQHAAFTTIDEALAFIRNAMLPIGPQPAER